MSVRNDARPPGRPPTSATTPGLMNPPSLAVAGEDSIVVTLANPPVSNSAPVDSYDLRRSVDGQSWSIQTAIANPETLVGLSAGTTYQVQTRAVNVNGAGPWSASAMATTDAAATVPAAFTAPGWALTDNADGGGMTVAVTALPDDGGSAITGIEYQVDAGSWQPLGGASPGSYTFSWPIVGTPISVALRAANPLGAGPASDVKTATPTAPAAAPGTMAAPSLAVVSASAISVSRAADPADGGSPILSYDLRYSTDEAVWTLVTGMTDPHLLSGLAAGTAYFVETRAVNAVGAGAWSATASATTQAAASVPGQMAAPGVAASGATALTVDRAADPSDGGSPITRFDLQVSVDGANWTLVTGISDPETVAGLLESTTYLVQTRAVNAVGVGSWSPSGSATTGASATVPAQMAAPVVSATGAGALTVDRAADPADGGSTITQFDLRHSTDEASWTAVPAMADPETISGLADGTTYFVQTRAANAVGAGAWSQSGSAATLVPPQVTGSVSDQSYLRRVAIPALDVSGAFSGSDLSYALSPASDPLPDGLALSAAGTLSGAPTAMTELGTPATVVVRGSNAAGTADLGFTVSVSGPVLQDLSVADSEVAFTTDTGEGVAYVWFGSAANPTDSEIQAGSGAAHLASASFPVGGTGGQLFGFDLSAHLGVTGYLSVMQVASTGASSVPVFTQVTVVTPAPGTPEAFTAPQWSVADRDVGQIVGITILTLPDPGSSAITDLEYQIGSGAWTSLAASATGSYDVGGLTNGTEVAVRIRAVNAQGPGLASDTKLVTPTAGVPGAFVGADWSVATGAGAAQLAVTVAALPASNGSAISAVQYDVGGSGTWTPLPSFAGVGTYAVSMPAAGTTYSIRLRAVNAEGAGAAGNAESAASGAGAGIPAIVSSAASDSSSGEVTSFSATMPASIVSGNKLVALVAADDAPTLSAAGWTKVGQADQFGNVTLAVFQKTATGGDTLTVSVASVNHVAVQVVQIENASVIEASFATGTSTAPDPPSRTLAGGTKDALVLAVAAHDDGNDSVTGIPAGYAQVGSGAKVALSNGVGLAVAAKDISAASEDPAAFAISATEQNVAATVVAYS